MSDSTIVGLPLATTIADDDVIPFTDISDTAEETTGKTKKITKSNLVASGGSYGALVSKVISGGAIDLTNTQHFVALTGEGDTTDALTAITKTGGGNLDVGFVVLLTGKAGLAYIITLADAGNFKLQRVFSIDNEYDSIPLIHRGSGIWQEMAGRVSNG
jgi:hypothetical protein